MTKKKKGTGLKYESINDVRLIPRYLLEQIKPKTFDPDRFYTLGPAITKNPLLSLGVFTKDDFVKGFMWAAINPLTEQLLVHVLSIDKEYQSKGVLGEVRGILKRIVKQRNLKGATFGTRAPRAFEKFGYKRTNMHLMEV
jgi:hypothetical protein